MTRVGAVGIAVFITILVWIYERRNDPLRDKPCYKCGETIHWVGNNYVHRKTGRDWEPYTPQEWLARRKADPLTLLPIPHPALGRTELI